MQPRIQTIADVSARELHQALGRMGPAFRKGQACMLHANSWAGALTVRMLATQPRESQPYSLTAVSKVVLHARDTPATAADFSANAGGAVADPNSFRGFVKAEAQRKGRIKITTGPDETAVQIHAQSAGEVLVLVRSGIDRDAGYGRRAPDVAFHLPGEELIARLHNLPRSSDPVRPAMHGIEMRVHRDHVILAGSDARTLVVTRIKADPIWGQKPTDAPPKIVLPPALLTAATAAWRKTGPTSRTTEISVRVWDPDDRNKTYIEIEDGAFCVGSPAHPQQFPVYDRVVGHPPQRETPAVTFYAKQLQETIRGLMKPGGRRSDAYILLQPYGDAVDVTLRWRDGDQGLTRSEETQTLPTARHSDPTPPLAFHAADLRTLLNNQPSGLLEFRRDSGWKDRVWLQSDAAETAGVQHMLIMAAKVIELPAHSKWQAVLQHRPAFEAIRTHNAVDLARIIDHETAAQARDFRGRTLLHEAVRLDRPEHVEVLLATGADPTILDDTHYTPLRDAAVYGASRAEAVLLPAVRKWNQQEFADAVLEGRWGDATPMLSAGRGSLPDLDTFDKGGEPILRLALDTASPKDVRDLVHAGANVHAAGSDGRTALEVARSNAVRYSGHLMGDNARALLTAHAGRPFGPQETGLQSGFGSRERRADLGR